MQTKAGLLAVASILALATSALAAQPVQTYTRSADPSRSEGLRTQRPYIPAADPRAGLLISPAPHPGNRVDSPDRAQLGRVWNARTPVGSRTPTADIVWGLPGPGAYGAPADAVHDVIFVQPREIDTVIAISPWQEVDENTLRQILRQEKNLGSTIDNPSSERLLNELRAARHQWLTEQGYIGAVRTHVNALPSDDAARPAASPASIKPRGVIRVVPADPVGKVAQAEPSAPAN
ncbi:MAG: hypothetical protein SFZ24_03495 [Planctomycetota bacterium]|nr:hypothetical protein [Planctomycetota bacterium]